MRNMASAMEKVLFAAGLGLAGTAAICLYMEKRREQQESEGPKADIEIPQSKVRPFPFTKMPERNTKVEDDNTKKEAVPEEGPEKPVDESIIKKKDSDDSKQGKHDPGNENPERSMKEDANSALHKMKEDANKALHKMTEAPHGEQEEKKGEDTGLFSWLMGRQKVKKQGAEDDKNEEKKE